MTDPLHIIESRVLTSSDKDTLNESLFLGTNVAKQLARFQGEKQDVTSECPSSTPTIAIESGLNLRQNPLHRQFENAEKRRPFYRFIFTTAYWLLSYSLSTSRKRHS